MLQLHPIGIVNSACLESPSYNLVSCISIMTCPVALTGTWFLYSRTTWSILKHLPRSFDNFCSIVLGNNRVTSVFSLESWNSVLSDVAYANALELSAIVRLMHCLLDWAYIYNGLQPCSARTGPTSLNK